MRAQDVAIIRGQPHIAALLTFRRRRRWQAHRVDDPEYDAEPQVGFWCPVCAAREFGSD